MPARVTVHAGNQQVGIELKDGVYRFGRQKPADIVVPDATVSSNHAELQVRGDEWLLRDLGSTNGTFINDEQVRASTKITERDRVRLGSVDISFERVVAPSAAPQPGGTVRLQAATEKASVAARQAAGKLSWGTRYWVAGAEAIIFMLILFLFIQLYGASVASKAALLAHYRLFAEQYVHVLGEGVTTVPAPVLDESLGDPVLVMDNSGKVLYPVGDAAPKKSPLINPTSKAVYQDAKLGLFEIPGTDDGKGVVVRSYPVRFGGELRGFIAARPAKVAGSDIKTSLLFMSVSAAIALIFLFFTLKPVHGYVALQLDTLRSKIGPLASGFVNELPRTGTIEEIDSIATEIENALRSARSQAGQKGGRGAAGGDEYAGLVAELFAATGVPYCIVDQDFKALVVSKEMREVTELSGVSKGTSIFEAGLSSVQSKQLVQTIGDARRTRVAQTTMSLSRRGGSQSHAVTVRTLEHPSNGTQLFGVAFIAQ